MSQAFTRILDNQSNKLLANLPSLDVNVSAPVVHPVPFQVQQMPLQVQSAPDVQVGEGNQECKNIKLFGFEFTIYTLILIVILVLCVGYFLYKYFFTKTDIVLYKKNSKKELKKNKLMNKEEFSKESSESNTIGSSVGTIDT